MDDAWGRLLFIGLLLSGLCLPGLGWAQGEGGSASPPPAGRTTEEIAAVVGTRTILRSEVEEQVQAVAQQLQMDLSDTTVAGQLRRDVLGRLVDDQVLLLEAEAQAIKVTDEEVQQSVDEEIQSNVEQMGEQGFRDELRKEGLTEAELRARYAEEARKQILARRLIQKEVQPKVVLPETAARDFFDENRDQLPKKPRQLRIQDLFVATRPDSVIERRALERAQDVRQKILDGMPFEEAVRTYSDDPRAQDGGRLGRVMRGQLSLKDVEDAAFALAPGEISQPVHSQAGYHLLKVEAKDPGGEWVELSHILFSVSSTRADEVAARDRAEKIYRELASGAISFPEAVRRYSDDSAGKERDGDLGWIPADNVYGEMKTVADTLRVGRLSRPVAGDGGYHIFRVQGVQAEGDYAFEEIEDQLRQLAGQKAMEKELRSYLDQLRKKYFVDIRMRG